jgi:hypothetical protein
MRLIKEYPWCKKYNIETVTIDVHPQEQYFTIRNSNKIKRSKHMLDVLKTVSGYYKSRHSLLYQLCEWKAHNLLYALKYQRKRTEHCDINEDVTLTQQIVFVALSLFYFK